MRSRIVLLTVAAMLLIPGCRDTLTSSSESGEGTSSVPGRADTNTLSVGDSVAGLGVPVLLQADDRDSISLDELRGSVVVLEFWATWCGPCVAAIGHLNELADEFADQKNVRFISLTDETLDTIMAFVARKPIRTWIGLDEQQALQKAFGVSAIPQTIVINSEGKIAAKISPSRLDASVLNRIRNGEMLAEESNGSVIIPGVDPSGEETSPPLMQLVLRESTGPSTGRSADAVGSTATLLDYPAKTLVLHAFGLRSMRTDFAAEVPELRYDLITRFPESTDDERQLVQSAIGSAFGIKLRHEPRNVGVFVVRLGDDGKHSLSDTVSTGVSSTGVKQTGINFVNSSLSNVLDALEGKLDCPLLDETGLTGFYDIVVTWEKDATKEQIAQAFTEATGLTLTSTEREIDFAVIEGR